MAHKKQIQVRISLTENLYEALRYKAKMLGVPVTQLVKFFIVKEVDDGNFFIPPARPKTGKTDKKMREIFNKTQYMDTKSSEEEL